MRTDPMSFVKELEKMRDEYGEGKSRLVEINGRKINMMSNEGAPAV